MIESRGVDLSEVYLEVIRTRIGNFERLLARYGERLGDRLDAVTIDDDATVSRMTATYQADDVVVCPHTAVGLEGLERLRAERPALRDVPAMVLATAHPAKFPDAVRRATGRAPPKAAELEVLLDRPSRVEPLAAEPAALRRALLDGAWPETAR